jgi:hypothetical protein
MSSNSIVFVIVFLLITFVMYKAASGDAGVIENWWGGLPPMTVAVDRTQGGQSKSGNNQASLYYSQNQFINENLLTDPQRSLVSQSINPNINSSVSLNTGSVLPSNSPQSLISNYNITQENYQEPKSGVPVFTVPGTYQADLSPRFNSNGLNSYVKYNLPNEQNLASYSNDPLTMQHRENYDPLQMANMVEKPIIREDFQSCKTATGEPYAEMYNKLAEQGAEVASKLPVQPMTSSNPNGDQEPIYYNADRYIFALQKDRLYGLADPIRGDLPIIPCLPNSNPYSNVWFKPSARPSVQLNAGALGIIGGNYNVTQQQLLELKGRDAGGAWNIDNGVNVFPNDTPVSNIASLQQAQFQNLDTGIQTKQIVNQPNPASYVQTTAFP